MYETGKKEFYPTIQQLWGRESVLHDNQSTSIFLIFKKMNNIPQSAFWVKINKPVLFYDYIGENVVQYVYQYNFNFPCHLRCNIL